MKESTVRSKLCTDILNGVRWQPKTIYSPKASDNNYLDLVAEPPNASSLQAMVIRSWCYESVTLRKMP